MLEIHLVRHGETIENTQHILQGRQPGHLTLQGIAQAERLRDALISRGLMFDAIVCSPLERAQRTAGIINEALKLPICATPLLSERDWGSITGVRIPDDHSLVIPEDAETVEAMFERAHKLICWLHETYDGKRLLLVGHGLFNRVFQAALRGVTIQDIPPMGNAEARLIYIKGNEPSYLQHTPTRGDIVSAN